MRFSIGYFMKRPFLSTDTNCTLTLQIDKVILISMLDIYKVQPSTNPERSRMEDLNLGPTNYKSGARTHSALLPP